MALDAKGAFDLMERAVEGHERRQAAANVDRAKEVWRLDVVFMRIEQAAKARKGSLEITAAELSSHTSRRSCRFVTG